MSGSGANGERKRVGQSSRYLLGGSNSLMRAPPGRRENLEQNGGWSHEQLMWMDARFVAAVERAIARGLERQA